MTDKIIEKFFGKKVCTEKLNIEGFNEPIKFDIYDGYAICRDHHNDVFDMTYPQLKIIKESKELYEEVIDHCGGITDKDEISCLNVLITFNTLYKNGVEVTAALTY